MLTINGMICIQVFGLNDSKVLVEAMLYVISIAITGIILGAVMSEQKSMNNALKANNESLARNNAKLKNMIKENQQLSKKLITSKEDERQKVSYELHDEVGQNLTALKLQLKLLENQFNEMNSDALLQKVNRGANQVYESIYRVMSGLQPSHFVERDLRTNLTQGQFRTLLSDANIHFKYELEGDLSQLDNKVADVLYYTVQECSNNCIKHANASTFILAICAGKDEVELTITDNGSFKEQSSHPNSGGFGLAQIERRVLTLKGRFIQTIKNGKFHLNE